MLSEMNSSDPPDDLTDDSLTTSAESTSPPAAASTRKAPYLATPYSPQQSTPGVTLKESHLRSHRPSWGMPCFLFAATCLSTFLAGTLLWNPSYLVYFTEDYPMQVRRDILRIADLGRGTTYMFCVVGILFAHEMGHYVVTRIYRIPSSLPFFIPFPLAPFGTMGAVIAMRGQQANRREIFDIGIAGPIAGLVLAVPIIWWGVASLELNGPTTGYRYDLPLLVRWMYSYLHPEAPVIREVYGSQVNAMFMAGWVGLLITGLNMLPVSQLDGGHVTYTLFGPFSRWIARLFVLGAIAYMGYRYYFMSEPPIWTLMLILIFVIGLYHPPTADDSVPLGWGRVLLGLSSLAIPILCFPPRGLMPSF